MLHEQKTWINGERLWDRPCRKGMLMPVVFSGAEAETRFDLLGNSSTSGSMNQAGRRSAPTFRLKPITPARAKSSLRLRVGNRPLSEDFIRPYAICHTPDFLS